MLVSLIFGFNYVAVKKVVQLTPPAAWMFWRVVLATAFLLPIALRWSRPPTVKGLWPRLVLASFLGVIVNQIAFAEGMARTLPGHGAVINSLIPVLTLAFAVLARQERLDWAKVLAVAVAMTGVLILMRVDDLVRGGVPDHDVLIGDLLVLVNAASFSAFLVLMRTVGRAIDPLRATAFSFLIGCLGIGAWSSAADAVSWQGLESLFAPAIVGYSVFAILGATVLSYLLNNWALRHAHSSQVALYIYLQPVVATSSSMVLTGERPDLRFYLSAVLACSGVLIQNLGRR